MPDFGIDSEMHSALTGKYGGHLDELATHIQGVLDAVQQATDTGIQGDFADAWLGLSHTTTRYGMQAQAALKQVQELIGKGRAVYIATDADNARPILNLPPLI